MNSLPPTRTFLQAVGGRLALAVILLGGVKLRAQPPNRQPAPIEHRTPGGNPGPGISPRYSQQTGMIPGKPVRNQQHLAEWMDSHRNLPLDQQQSALENEPGFHSLKPQEQQRMHARLQQLNALPPQQQQRVLARTEAMERLPPAERQQIRGAAAQLGGLAPDRRKAVASAFHSALDLPENQRQAWLDSAQTRAQFNDQERGTLNNLLQVAPAAQQVGLPGFVPRSQQPRFNQPPQ